MAGSSENMSSEFTVHRITSGPEFHIKAYYDIPPWSPSGRLFMCMETEFEDRPPKAEDVLTLGVVDIEEDVFIPLTETRAWNFQQGCMPHWLGEDEIIYNDRIDDAFRSVVMNVASRAQRILPRPIQAVTPDGSFGLTINYARWGEWRPGYGYAGPADPFHGRAEPAEDEIGVMDLRTGECRTLVTMGDVAALTSALDERKGTPAHLCHPIINTDGTRVQGITRWWAPELAANVASTKANIDGAVPERRHCMWVVDMDGSDLNIVVNDGLVSHAEWRDEDHVLVWANPRYDIPPAYLLFDVRDNSHEVVGEGVLTEDGHMSYHPLDRRWFVTDTYPDQEHMRTLKLYNVEEGREVALGRFHAPPDLTGELRCDLHPSWNADGTQIAIDSIHEGGRRQVYVIEVGDVTQL